MPNINLTVNFQGGITSLNVSGLGSSSITPSNNTATLSVDYGTSYTVNTSLSAGYTLYRVTGTGCTISNIQDASFNVVFNDDTATINISAWQMTTVIGTYTLNLQNLAQLGNDGETYDFSINYRSDGTSYAGFEFWNSSTWTLRYTGIAQPPVAYSSNTGWTNQHYRTIAFGDAEQDLPTILKNWIEANGTPAMYSVAYTGSNVSVSVTGGTAHAQGETVTFNVTPAFGYDISAVTAASSGQNVPVTPLGGGEYSFTMPGGSVVIAVTTDTAAEVYPTCTVTIDENIDSVRMYVSSAGKGYSFTSSIKQWVMECTPGESIGGTVYLESGYGLSTVTAISGCTVTSLNTTTGTFNVKFTDSTARLSITSKRVSYSITKVATNCTITAPSTANAGTSVQFTVVANTGYSISNVIVRRSNGSAVSMTALGSGRYSFTMPDSNVTITATAMLSSTNCTVTFDEGTTVVTTTAGNGGTWNVSGTAVNLSGITTSGTYTFNVTLAQGYTLSNVTGTGCTILSTSETSFVVGFTSATSRISIVAEKEGVESYPIEYEYENATLTGAVSSAEADSTVSFSVLPANGYEVDGVTARASTGAVTVNVSGSTYSFTMPAAAVTVTVLTALAPQTSDLTVNFDSGVGYVSANINGESVSFSETGSAQEVSYIPGEINAFTAALVNGYRLSYVNGENCTISDIDYTEGAFNVVFTGTPSTVNIGTQALEPETVEVALAVTFDAGVASVSTVVDGGAVTWTTSGSRQTFETQEGATRDFSISLVSGYYLNSVSGTGCTITAQTENGFSVLFTSTTPNISIVTQRAAQISYPISYSYTSGTLNGPSSAEEGEMVTFTFTPENGYTVGNVTVMGNTSIEVENSGNTYSFYMPAEPVAVSITVNTPDIITIQTLGVFKEEGDKAYAPFNVVYAPATLTDEQKAQARENIGAVSETELTEALEPYALQDGTYAGLSAGHATEADRATGDEDGNRIISFYGHDLTLSVNPQTYVMTITLVSEDGTVLATRSIDLPLESMVVSGTYDEETKKVVLTLQNGQQVRFSVADLVDGLASQDALDAETQAREAADAALAQEISALEDGTTPAGVASKLATEDVGSTDTPAYFENGVPVACGDSLSVNITGTANNADNLGGSPSGDYVLKNELPFFNTEYGVRFALGEDGNIGPNPTGQRVIRYNGILTEWNPSFTPNVGDGTSVSEIHDNEFDYIPIFSPKLYKDNAGNVFRRFKPFYWGRQVMGGYLYIWVCETPLYPFYRMPQAFIKDGKVGYRDISVYEGAFETIGDVTYLCSKPGLNPVTTNSKTQFWQKAQAWQTYLSADTNNEWYGITQISEITEILQPLVMIMFGTLNSQSVYNGVVAINWNYANTGVAVDAYNEGTMTLYFSTNALKDYRVGGTACINGVTTSDDYYRQIIANGTVTGTVSGNTFTPSDDGETYYYITISGTSFPATPTTICARPIYTGETDAIEATSGTLSNNGLYSFKVLGIENVWGNVFKFVLDVSIYNYIPQKLISPYEFTEFSTSNYTQYYTAANYGVVETAEESGWITKIGWQDTLPDVQLPVFGGGSSSTYYCDIVYTDNSQRNVLFGGCFYSAAGVGLFSWSLNAWIGGGFWAYGARLSHWALIEK